MTINVVRATTSNRIAIMIPSMRGGGAERVTLILAQELAQRGYAVDLVLVEAEGAYLDQVPDTVRIIDLNASRLITALPALVRYLRSERPQSLMAMMAHTSIIALWAHRLARVSTRLVVNERVTLSWRTTNRWHKRNLVLPTLVKWFYPWADRVVAVAEGVKDDLVEIGRIAPTHINTIYNPIVRPEIRQKAQQPLDHPWFQADEPPVILAAGRLVPQKDFPLLIRAFADVLRTHKARLLILGEGPDRAELEALIADLGLSDNVVLPGFAENPYNYMANAKLFVLSSRWEGLPGVLIEAMYCGTPVIATDCPSGPNEVLDGGRFGELIAVGDQLGLATAIRAGLDGNIPQPVPASWQRFTLDTIVNQYLNVLM